MVPVSGYEIFHSRSGHACHGFGVFFPHLEVAEFGVLRVKKSVLLQGGLDIWNSTSQVPQVDVVSHD